MLSATFKDSQVMTKIAIIGGSGFIGTILCKKLLELHHEIIIVDKNPSEAFPQFYHYCDIRNLAELEKSCQDIEIIYHLAAEHRDDVTPISLYYDVNVTGTANIIKAAEKHNIKKIIFTSTVALYGLNTHDTDENAPAAPFNDYGKSKLQAEELLNHWQSSEKDRDLLVIRPTVVFGENNRGNVYNLMRQVIEGPFIMIGKGENKKSIAYVENVADFLVAGLSSQGFDVFNYADKPDLSVKQLIDIIKKTKNNTKNSLKLPFQLGLLIGSVFDFLNKITGKRFPISKIRIKKFASNTIYNAEKMQAKFTPSVSLEAALRKTIEHEFM